MYTRYAGDPHWTTAKFTSTCKSCGRTIAKGEPIFYYPRSRGVYCQGTPCGKEAERDFVDQAEAEYFITRGREY